MKNLQGGNLMKESITRFRERTNITQEAIAIDAGTNKANISNIEAGRRNASMNIFQELFKNIDDSTFLNDVLHETTNGFATPIPSHEVYDDHRLSSKYRLSREIQEFQESLVDHRLDKRPEYLTKEEKDQISLIVSEGLDVAFEITAFVLSLEGAYDFINLRKKAQDRNLRYEIDKRI